MHARRGIRGEAADAACKPARGRRSSRTARPDQQREEKALAAFDIPLMRAGCTRMRSREQRDRPARAGSAGRETRLAVFDQAEIDQRDCRALPHCRDASGVECAKPAAFREGAHDIALQVAIVEETVEPALVGPDRSGADRAAPAFQRRFEIAEPRRRIVPPGVPPGNIIPARAGGGGREQVRGHGHPGWVPAFLGRQPPDPGTTGLDERRSGLHGFIGPHRPALPPCRRDASPRPFSAVPTVCAYFHSVPDW